MIPQRNLSLLANRLARGGGRRIPEAVLERDYCLSWFLVGLSGSPLRDRLVFKGGTALRKCYFPDYRFSEDLDFTLAELVDFDTVRSELDAVFDLAYRQSGVILRYARDDRQPHANSYTFYVGYEGPLPGTPGGKEVKVDSSASAGGDRRSCSRQCRRNSRVRGRTGSRLKLAGAEVAYHDPFVPRVGRGRRYELDLESTPLTADVLGGVDAGLIVTDHSAVDYDFVVRHAALVVDTRNVTRGVVEGREKIVKA